MADNDLVSNSPVSSNNDIRVRSTADPAGNKIQHMRSDTSEDQIIDDVSASVSYYGFAFAGTATSAASWRIKKKTVSGAITRYSWADGTDANTKVWDDRATYTYL